MVEYDASLAEPIALPHQVTIILPVHNEEEGLWKLTEDIDQAFKQNSRLGPVHLLFINDGSSDNSLAVIQDIISTRNHASCVNFSRNFGHQVAVMAGLNYAPDGSIVVVMDSDGQDPPSIALELVEQVMAGVDVAYGIRWRREGRNWLKRLAYWSFYRILSSLSSIKIPLDAGDFCAYSPKAVKLIAAMPEKHPYVRGLRAWVGLTQVGVPYRRPERHAGQASYNFKGLLKLAFDGIISFSLKPLRMAIALGFVTFIMCIFLGFLYLTAYVFDWHFLGARMRDVPGFTTIVLLVLLTSSLQMLMLGVIGEYVGRLFEESKKRPLFIVAETFGDLTHNQNYGKRQSHHYSK